MPLSESQLEARRIAARLLADQREEILRFAAGRLGDAARAKRFVCGTLLRRLSDRDKLQRGECLPVWFERKLTRALLDWSEENPAQADEASRQRMQAWSQTIQGCLRELLEIVEPRYREVLQRVDFGADSKVVVARELGISRSTMDVLLHRARQAVRRSLEKVCAPPDESRRPDRVRVEHRQA